MTLHVDPLEAIWFIVTVATLLFTFQAFLDARHDSRLAQEAAETDESSRNEARLLTARGNVRREGLRIIVQVLLLSLVLPGLFDDHPIPLNTFVLALIAVPILLLISTVADKRERGQLAYLLLQMMTAERLAGALESSVQANIELTKEGIEHAKVAGDKADAAYHEANSVNEKIAHLTEIVGASQRILTEKESADEPTAASRQRSAAAEDQGDGRA